MKTLLSLILAGCSIILFARQPNTQGIQFQPDQTSLRTLLEQSKATKKLIFIDAYTSWCGPCKWMDKNVFTASEVGNFFNEQFINARFNMEQGEGIELRKKYQVMTYPTFLFLNAEGIVVHRICGSSNKEAFITKAKAALDDQTNLNSFVTKYNNGNRDAAFLRQYLELGVSMCMEMHNVATEYWSALDQQRWIAPENWTLFTTYVRDFESDQFQYLIKNFETATADNKRRTEVEEYIHEILYHTLLQPIIKKDDRLLSMTREKIRLLNIPPAKKALILTKLVQHEKSKDWKSYFAEVEEYIQLFLFDRPERINDFAWTIYQNIDDKTMLTRAAEWMQQMLEVEKNKKYIYLETYAALLRKTGNIRDADKVTADAIALAESKGENYRAEREIREAKASLRADLDQIKRDIDQAVKDGDTEKAASLERARQDRISTHNEKITKLLAAGSKE